MSFKSKKMKMMITALSMAGCMIFAGCGSKAPAPTPDPVNTVVEESNKPVANDFPVVEVPDSEIPPQPPETEGPVTTIIITWECSDGAFGDLTENLDITPLRADAPAERYCEYFDEGDNLVYSWSRDYEEGDDGIVRATCVYNFFTLDYSFDLIIEPNGPENSSDLQSITAVIERNGLPDLNYTFEDIGRRGQTGIWYAGVCSCREGAVTEYQGF